MSKVYRWKDGSYNNHPEGMFNLPPEISTPNNVLGDIETETKKMRSDYLVFGNTNVHEDLVEFMKPKEGGTKYDDQKVPLDLIPYEALEEIGKVLLAGQNKYGVANWANGIEMRTLLSAAMRHLGQFNAGEDLDSETQTLHIANAATNLLFAIWMYKNRPDLDNRWIKGIKK